ncbi:hypothetical protein HXX76_003613 [Chlamydomonas incerta]|uniref:Uncharacterized protein n=1 Tax=Chlamydomonas incerta TaxID=51695 RepID=A0A835W934_CHLIN|nr:hypothetical protein HXX76_003613 [Chlamydomonas incerta]|eukprot:KAG2440756.1 hypothetical protein HXX76_003613 [Chlamydomonas incerta]
MVNPRTAQPQVVLSGATSAPTSSRAVPQAASVSAASHTETRTAGAVEPRLPGPGADVWPEAAAAVKEAAAFGTDPGALEPLSLLPDATAGLTLVPFTAAQMRTAGDGAVGPSGGLMHVAEVEIEDDEEYTHSSTCVFDADAAAAAAAAAAAGAAAHPVSYLQQDDSSACSGDSSMLFSGPCPSASMSSAVHGYDPSKGCSSARGPSDTGATFQQLSAQTAHLPTPAHLSHRHSQAGWTVTTVPASALQPAATAPVAPMAEADSISPFNSSLRASRGTSCVLPATPHLLTSLSPQASHASCAYSLSSSRRSLRDQNSVTIKATTVVKDAAGAIDKILARGVTALVTALRSGPPPYGCAYDSLNQAVKAIAVARQYAKETGPEGAEVTFLPFHRNDATERPDPLRLAFLVFPVAQLREPLKTADETVLNVARGSDVHKMASAVIAVMLDRGQAVMKAAGAEAIFVAMSAVVNARHRLVAKHGFDLMLAAAWITEDTQATMGRESKFLRFNILKTEPAGPKSLVAPTLPAGLDMMCPIMC